MLLQPPLLALLYLLPLFLVFLLRNLDTPSSILSLLLGSLDSAFLDFLVVGYGIRTVSDALGFLRLVRIRECVPL